MFAHTLYEHLSSCQHCGKWSYHVARGKVEDHTKEDGDRESWQCTTDNPKNKTSHTETLGRVRKGERERRGECNVFKHTHECLCCIDI